jgi:hypothetical protein
MNSNIGNLIQNYSTQEIKNFIASDNFDSNIAADMVISGKLAGDNLTKILNSVLEEKSDSEAELYNHFEKFKNNEINLDEFLNFINSKIKDLNKGINKTRDLLKDTAKLDRLVQKYPEISKIIDFLKTTLKNSIESRNILTLMLSFKRVEENINNPAE